MVFSRKIFHSNKGFSQRSVDKKTAPADRRPYKSLQWKYAFYLAFTMSISLMLFSGPAVYWVYQNYDIFSQFANQTAPELLPHLERELTWFSIMLVFAWTASLGLALWMGFKVTGFVIGPLVGIERHMKSLTQGNWSSKDFRLRSSDDYRSLANTYSYFYRTARSQVEEELKILKGLSLDQTNKDSFRAWRKLIDKKEKMLLGQANISWIAEETSSSPSQRRAS